MNPIAPGFAIVVSSGGSKKGGSPEGNANGAKQAAQLLNGIPQSGTTLGNPKAPVKMAGVCFLPPG